MVLTDTACISQWASCGSPIHTRYIGVIVSKYYLFGSDTFGQIPQTIGITVLWIFHYPYWVGKNLGVILDKGINMNEKITLCRAAY